MTARIDNRDSEVDAACGSDLGRLHGEAECLVQVHAGHSRWCVLVPISRSEGSSRAGRPGQLTIRRRCRSGVNVSARSAQREDELR